MDFVIAYRSYFHCRRSKKGRREGRGENGVEKEKGKGRQRRERKSSINATINPIQRLHPHATH